MGRQHQGMDRPGVRQLPEGSGEQGKMEKSGCKIICGAPTTLAIKGLMMMMMKKSALLSGVVGSSSFPLQVRFHYLSSQRISKFTFSALAASLY